ncbi:hypothetical protein U1763_10495 [Sphingomonas sp. LB2R24]|uniref:hypothetical protein n=1 Tax=Sphingomonas sorbitolis TaxID=3096165 RepID=UPI002FCCA9B7
MLVIATTLLTVIALAAGAWLTLYAIILLIDVTVDLSIANVAGAVASMRHAIFAVWIGLALFSAGSTGVAKILA